MNERLCSFLVAVVLASAGTVPALLADVPPLAKPGEDGYISGELIYQLDNKPQERSTIVHSFHFSLLYYMLQALFSSKTQHPTVTCFPCKHTYFAR
jgi:hypothetical protein